MSSDIICSKNFVQQAKLNLACNLTSVRTLSPNKLTALKTTLTPVPFSDRVELQALDGHGGSPVGMLRLEDGAEAPSAQVVQVRQLLVGDHRQSAR